MIQCEGPLFEMVQNSNIFTDSKTFVDCIPNKNEGIILEEFLSHKCAHDFSLENFVHNNFILPKTATSSLNIIDQSSLSNYIESLWPILQRNPTPIDQSSSLIPLTKPYIVPGGRFGEIYYWDSYFTSVGLATINRFDIIRSMIDNFIGLQKTIGLIPNGNRKYYQTRSQPPVLGFMIDLLYSANPLSNKDLTHYTSALETEYLFWMHPNNYRVIQMPDGSLLNRYCDFGDFPRAESYREDKLIAKDLSEEDAKILYKNIRSAAESGWDFSSRWMKDPNNLRSLQTTSIVPIDLNALLFGIEQLLAKYYLILNHPAKSQQFTEAATQRRNTINQYLWNDEKGFYFDFNIDLNKQSEVESLAAVVPLFVNMTTDDQAKNIAHQLQNKFLKQGGLVTTLIESDQQWDSPNGWAPLQYFAAKGLINYSQNNLAKEIVKRWLNTLTIFFDHYHVLPEKCNVMDPTIKAGGGEYPLQEGFGWTNGVILAFQKLQNE